jgi:hypothetical protein
MIWLGILRVMIGSLILFTASSIYAETTSSTTRLLPGSLGNLAESAYQVRCTSANKREEIFYLTVDNLKEFACVEFHMEILGGLKRDEYGPYILEIHGKRYGDEISVGWDAADLFLGKKTPKLFPQLYALLIRFSPQGKNAIQRFSDTYLELLSFRFDETPKLVKREALKEGVVYEQFLQRGETPSEGGAKVYTGQIFRILTEDTLIMVSGINLSEELWKEILEKMTHNKS